MNRCHHRRSERKSFVSRIKWDSSLKRAAAPYILETNVLPGITTLVACCSRPTRDRISLLVTFLRGNQNATWFWILLSLSSGKRACMEWVSRVIPKNVRLCEGPSIFSKARGIPSKEQISLITVRLLVHVGNCGGPMVRKSSKQCKIGVICCHSSIHGSRLARTLKSFGANLSPNGKQVSMYMCWSHFIDKRWRSAGWTGNKRKALLVSIFARRVPHPNCLISWMAQSTVTAWLVEWQSLHWRWY